MAFNKLTAELAGPINRRVDLPPELALGLSESGSHFFQRGSWAHNHYVNVARRCFGSGSNRAINEGQLDRAPECGQGFLQDLRRTEGFADQPA